MQDTVYLITGTSSGIGNALAHKVLSHSKVIGVARNKNIQHENYQHHVLDLNDLNDTKIDELVSLVRDFENIHIIHNAGMIEPIAPVSKLDNAIFEKNHTVNFIAPAQITNSLLNQLQTKIKTITFIGSGAARHTIDAWSAYCSAKAALLMFAKCLQQEYNDRNIPLKVFDISPGIIDTPMQEKIRNSDQELFLQKERFDALYENGELTSPQEVSQKIDHLLKNFASINALEVNLREYAVPDNQ